MKKITILLICIVIATCSFSQSHDSDQNPDYRITRTKYLGLRDSLIMYEGGTVQETYKAYDYMEDMQERKDAKTAFKRQLRLAKVQSRGSNGHKTYPDGNYQPYTYPSSGTDYYNGQGYYNYNYYPNNYNYNDASGPWQSFKSSMSGVLYTLPLIGLGYLFGKN